jgi:cellulase (glycosyl hydrolase family 5)
VSSALARSTYGRTTIAALLVATLAAILLALAPAAHAAKGMEISLQDEGALLPGGYFPDKDKAYSLAKGIEVSRVRFNATWGGLNIDSQCRSKSKPSNPQYDFSRLDAGIKDATSRGFKILLTITGPGPAWANGKKTCDVRKGADFNPNAKEFGKFAKLVAKRYASQVDQYAVWNEPNRKGWLESSGRNQNNGNLYRNLFLQGYKAIKAADPSSTVLIGEMAPYVASSSLGQNPLAFLRQLTCTDNNYKPLKGKRCPTLKADGFSHHAYDFARPPNRAYPNRDAVTIANLSRLTSALDKLKRVKRLVPSSGKRWNLYLTEYGYFASKVPGGRSTVYSDTLRASYLVKAYKIAQKNTRVREMLQFLLIQYPGAGTSQAGFNFDTSIVKLDGTKTKSYDALAAWAQGAADKGQIKPAP